MTADIAVDRRDNQIPGGASAVSSFRIKRIYELAGPDDGHRILVDGMWPRGVRKADAGLEEWLRGIAPSPELCRWFGHDGAKWDEFRQRYAVELDARPELVGQLRRLAENGPVTLLFAARDGEHNNAVALKAYLDGAEG